MDIENVFLGENLLKVVTDGPTYQFSIDGSTVSPIQQYSVPKLVQDEVRKQGYELKNTDYPF